ncbi:MAG: hypothetical protein IT210_01255 [Armatimonadetes bacterium]|nr:hypothetical protein [Armatimonadota bacterium]
MLWGLALLYCAAYGAWRIAWSMTAGTALSLGMIKTLEWMVRKSFSPEARKPAALLGGLAISKFTFIGLVLWAVVRWNLVDLLAFGAGFAGVHLVIFLKVTGGLLAEKPSR